MLEVHGVARIECGHRASGYDIDTPEDLNAIGNDPTELEVNG
jgi:hypothetical protein